MTPPIEVQIVRPKKADSTEVGGRIVYGVGFAFLFAWLLMLIAGTVTPWHLSYWHTLLGYVGLRLLPLRGASSYIYWTKR